MRIDLLVSVPNLFTGWESVDRIDQDASAYNYLKLLFRNIAREYSEATITADTTNDEGAVKEVRVSGDSAEEEESAVLDIDYIRQRVFNDSEGWLVELNL